MDSRTLLTKMCNVCTMSKSYYGRGNPAVYSRIMLAKILVTFVLSFVNKKACKHNEQYGGQQK